MIKHLFRLSFLGFVLTGSSLFAQISSRPDDSVIRQAIQKSEQGKILSSGDISYELTDFHRSKKSGAQHIYMRQKFNDLEIIGTESSLHLSSDGKISSVKNSFLNSLEKRAVNAATSPQISAAQAAGAAFAHLGYTATGAFSVVSQDFTPDRKTLLSNGGFALSNIPARLVYGLTDDGQLELAWTLSIEAMQISEWYEVRVSASTGQVLNKGSYVNSCDFGHTHE